MVNDTLPNWLADALIIGAIVAALGFWTYKKYFARKD